MRKNFIRGLSLLLCLCMFVTGVPVLEASAVSEEEFYRGSVLEQYSESFLHSDYYLGLTNGNRYSYKLWCDEIEQKCAISQGFMWAERTLLGKNLNREAYVDYLCSLLTMVENGFSENLAAQASYTNQLSLVDYAADATDLISADLIPIRKKELKIACEYIGASADLQTIIDHQPTRVGEFNEYITANYILMADITLPDGYESLAVFAGVLDGNGYSISNIRNPLFGKITDAEIKNLALNVNCLKDMEDEIADYGALALYTNGFSKDGNTITIGYNEGHNTIDNCYVTGYINLKMRSGDVGALVGNARFMEISNCYNTAEIYVETRQSCQVGGLVGTSGEVSNSFNTGKISGYASAENTLDPWGVEVVVGGIGGSETAVRYSYNTGDITGSAGYACRVWCGGIVGWSWLDCKIENCFNTDNVQSFANYPSDRKTAILEDEQTYFAERDWAYFASGGIVGHGNCTQSQGKIGEYDWVKNCWNSGAVQSRHYSGGIVGYATSLYVVDCYNTGSVSGDNRVGGLVGIIKSKSQVTNCYSTADVSGGKEMGSLAGLVENDCPFSNCFYLSGGLAASSSGTPKGNAKALTKEQMADRESFEGFDFQKVWALKTGQKTPTLRFREIEEV